MCDVFGDLPCFNQSSGCSRSRFCWFCWRPFLWNCADVRRLRHTSTWKMMRTRTRSPMELCCFRYTPYCVFFLACCLFSFSAYAHVYCSSLYSTSGVAFSPPTSGAACTPPSHTRCTEGPRRSPAACSGTSAEYPSSGALVIPGRSVYTPGTCPTSGSYRNRGTASVGGGSTT